MIILLPNKTKEADICYIISKNIKKYRLKKHLTQLELSKKTGYSYAYIRRLEAINCKKNFSIKTIEVLANALGISVKALFDDESI